MTIINPKSIAGVTSITTPSGSDNLFTVHTNNTTERVRINNDGDVIVGSGITVSPDGDIFTTGVTTATTFVGALTGNVTGNATGLSGTPNISAGTIAGSTGTFTGDVDIADKIVHTGDTNTAIRFPSADTFTVETGGTERLRINSDGRIAVNDTGNVSYTSFSPCIALGDSGDSQPALVLRGSATSKNDISFCDNSGVEGDDGVSEGLLRYDHNGDYMCFHTADSERLRIASNGNIGIGNDASFPVYTHINSRNFMLGTGGESTCIQIHSSSTTYGGIYFGDVADRTDANSYIGSIEYKHGDDYMNFRTNGSERLRIDSSGRLLLGTTTEGHASANEFTIASSATTGLTIRSGTSSEGNIYFSKGTSGSDEYKGIVAYLHSNNAMQFYTDASERMRISSDGGLFLGVTSAVSSSSGGVCFRDNDADRKELLMGTTTTSTRALVEFINSNGSVGSISVSGSNTSYNTSSDYRLKENVTAISDGISRLKTLKPSRFNFIADAETTVDGFLAHEVTAVPEAVTGTKDEVATEDSVSHKKGDPIYQSIDQSKLVPLLTAALQEAVTKIEVLETRLNNAGIAT